MKAILIRRKLNEDGYCPDGDYLIYYMRVENHEKAREVFKNSQLPIDVYHKQFKTDTWAENKKLELLVDLEVWKS